MRMRTTRFAGNILALVAFASTTSEAFAAPPPAEAFGCVPAVVAVEISPNGNLVAWGDNSGTGTVVKVLDLEQQKIVRAIAIDAEMKLRGIVWTDDETLLFNVSATTSYGSYHGGQYSFEVFRTLAADVSGGPARILLMDADKQVGFTSGSNLLAVRTAKPKTVIMWSWDDPLTKFREDTGTNIWGGSKDSGWVASVYEVDTRTGVGQPIMQGSQFTENWLVDGAGRPFVRIDHNPKLDTYLVLADLNGSWRTIYRQVGQGELALQGVAADNASVVAIGSLGQDHGKLLSIPLNGSGASVLLEDPQRDVKGVRLDAYTRVPVGAWLGGSSEEVRWLEAKTGARHQLVARAFPDRQALIISRSENGKRVIVDVSGASTPTTYYLVDFAAGKADIIGEEYPTFEGLTFGEVRTTSYKARDGYEIPAYVTLPPGVKVEKLPLVVLPHGGPESRDEPGFNWLAQFLATRGYAVLQPQFRGSTGFGEQHHAAGIRQWGGVMQDDVTDGVKALIGQGLVDEARVCIVGANYGGYVALAAVAFTPEIYKCAVSINGISDLPALLDHIALRSGNQSDAYWYMRNNVGSASDPFVIQKSPARSAANVRVPILLIHADDDKVVPVSQAERMAKALEKAGKPYNIVKLPGGDHWLAGSETRIRVLMELETFLAQKL